jgi:hypothetical protein
MSFFFFSATMTAVREGTFSSGIIIRCNQECYSEESQDVSGAWAYKVKDKAPDLLPEAPELILL